MALVIGIGNPFRRDDGIGPVVAGRIAALGLPGVTVRLESGEGAALMQCWAASDSVIVVDALRSGGAPGQLRCFEAHREIVPTDTFRYSSHAFGLAEAIEVARALEQLPEALYVVGIEGTDFFSGTELSAPVAAAVAPAVDKVLELLEKCGIAVNTGAGT